MKGEATSRNERPSVHVICGDLLGTAASAALLVRLFGIRDDDLRRLRMRIRKGESTAPGLLDWLDHLLAWEQDRRAGYDYPLRGPTEAIRDDEIANSIVAVEMLGATFRGEMQIASLLDLLKVILPLDRPMGLQQRSALATGRLPNAQAATRGDEPVSSAETSASVKLGRTLRQLLAPRKPMQLP